MGMSRSNRMEKNEEGLKPDAIASKWLFLFLLIVFGLAWSLFALFVFVTDWVVGTFGELSGRNPSFILAAYAPAIAALLLIGFTASLQAEMPSALAQGMRHR